MLELGPLLSPDKLLVSLAVGHKLKVLQVCVDDCDVYLLNKDFI